MKYVLYCIIVLFSLMRDGSMCASLTLLEHRIYSDIYCRGYTENYCPQVAIFSVPLERVRLYYCHIVNCG